MPTTSALRRIERSTIYMDKADADVLRELASDLGLVQPTGGGARYQAGSLSALMRFLSDAARTPHRPSIVAFFEALQTATATTDTDPEPEA